MATMNPLERKARSSFIKGFLVALLIGILVSAFLGYQLYNMKVAEDERLNSLVTVKVLTEDVAAGELITSDMLKDVSVDPTVKSATAVKAYEDLAGYLSADTDGNIIKTKTIEENGVTQNIKVIEITEDGKQNDYEIVEDANGSWAYTKEDGSTVAISLADTTYIAKIDLSAKTIISPDMLSLTTEKLTDDLRSQEYNMVSLPTELVSGDTVDIRLRLPSGADYIVLSKKKVSIPLIEGVSDPTTIVLQLSEIEILTMSCAIIDSYKIEGSKLYANKYTDPGIQKSATVTYVPSNNALTTINNDPNISSTAKEALVALFNSDFDTYRKLINDALSATLEEEQSANAQSGTSTEISSQESIRRTYLEGVSEGSGS